MSTLAKVGVVSDTGVYLRASINAANVSSSLLHKATVGEMQLYVSRDLLDEVQDVLTRPEIRAKNARLSDEALQAFLREVEAQAILIDPLPQHFSYSRDPDDEHILNLAIEAGASYIASFDNDLLDLMRSKHEEAQDFRRRFPNITILTPGEIITRVNVSSPKRARTGFFTRTSEREYGRRGCFMNRKKKFNLPPNHPEVIAAVLEDLRTMPIEELEAMLSYRKPGVEVTNMNEELAQWYREQKAKRGEGDKVEDKAA